MLTCPHCSRRNNDDAKACAGCGGDLAFKDVLGLARNPGGLLGKVLNGKYQVLEVLGEGGMGVVYKVRHLILKNRNLFAMKILHPRFSNDEQFQGRFLREVEVAMELTHENIVQIREFGLTEENLLFFTMDYFEGETLKSLLGRERSFAPERAVAVARELLLALAEAHRAGVVHRDLKPDNVLLAAIKGRDCVRILDFGIAKILEADSQAKTLTQGGAIGTPRYMSPEQASGEPVDGRSDLYSLGILTYELLMGRAPFTTGTARTILVAHLTTPPAPFRKVRPDLAVPARLEKFVFTLLEKEPRNRPQSAEECLEMLEATGAATVPLPGRKAEGAGRRGWRLAGAAALLALLGAGSLFLPWGRRFERGPSAEARADGFAPHEARAGGPAAGTFLEPAPPAAPRGSAGDSLRRWRCTLCGQAYRSGERPGNICHGEPLVESDGRD
jgi:tRNA A-37 threonylcarbamoyl transferase component Bud32